MADSYHIIDGQVVPYSGGRRCNDTDAWRDATPLELQLQEQLVESEHAIAAKDAEIEALRADAERYRWLRRKVSAHGVIDGWTFAFPTHLALPAPASAMRDPAGGLDAAIDRARGKGVQGRDLIDKAAGFAPHNDGGKRRDD